MGTMVLIIAFVVEAAFAAYCIFTKSGQRIFRNYMRIGALAAFVLLAIASVIQWGFRWYLLAVLLFFWAALGSWGLLRKKGEDARYGAWRSTFRAFGTLLLIFVAAIPALVFPQVTLPKPTGNHPVVTATYTYTDLSRVETFSKTGGYRELNVEFWYPRDGGGPYPLIVFSHGTGGLKTSNTSTFMDLASNGYVVCSIDHPYHSFFTVDANGNRAIIDQSYLQQYLSATSGKYDDATELKLEQQWMSLRIADIKFALDTILQHVKESGSASARNSSSVYQLIDPAKIGLIGHSLGGESSAQVARERNDISAMVNLDADLAGEYLGIQNGKRVINDKPYPIPILNIFSDTLESLMDKVPDANNILAVRHLISTNPKAYEVHLTGTDHMSFTDLPLVSPLLVSVINGAVPNGGGVEVNPYGTIEKMNATVLQFFNAFLKGKGSFSTAGSG